ncbi:MAG: HD domain-containing protein, partial [Bacteroidota bacterium]
MINTKKDIIETSENYVFKLLDNLSEDYSFHNTEHTRNVRNVSMELASAEGLSDGEKEVLELAALFHDVGYAEVYKGHEQAGAKMASSFLKELNIDQIKIDKVVALILSTE